VAAIQVATLTAIYRGVPPFAFADTFRPPALALFCPRPLAGR
jgi:hypothetical protein